MFVSCYEGSIDGNYPRLSRVKCHLLQSLYSRLRSWIRSGRVRRGAEAAVPRMDGKVLGIQPPLGWISFARRLLSLRASGDEKLRASKPREKNRIAARKKKSGGWKGF